MAGWLTGLFESPQTRADVESPATGRVDGDDSVWRFQWWKWLTAIAVTAGQTVWYLGRPETGAPGIVGYAVMTFVGASVVIAGCTWAVRRIGLFQWERPWVAVPALLASAVAVSAPLVIDDATGPFVVAFVGSLVAAGAVRSLRSRSGGAR